MEELRVRKYRECGPGETVERIRDILGELGLTPVESGWCRTGECLFSLSLSLPGTCIEANGKGVTTEYALASAYGELMERLQNMAVFRLHADMPERAHRRGGFLYAPDEVVQGMGEILASEDLWVRGLWDTVTEGTDRVSYLRRWKQVCYEKRQGDFYGIPYISLTEGCSRIFPMNMLSRLYLTNGMCAGNSREEALIHGLCECFERYANRMAALGKCPLKKVSRKSIGDTEKKLIQALEECGYAVTIYDASLGMGLPVAAALLADRCEGRYLVRFGAAPDPALGIERALTELMQGQRGDRIQGMQPIHVRPDTAKKSILGILTYGIGAYPFDCFSEEHAGELPDYGGATMAETLQNLVALARRLHWEVLFRDVSFLGFPAAHVVVPSMSEVEDFGDRDALCRCTGYQRIKRQIRRLGDLGQAEARKLLQAIEEEHLPEAAGVLEMLHIDIADTIPWYYRSLRLLKLSLALYGGDMDRAAEMLDTQAAEETGNESLYYRCARDVCLLRGRSAEEYAVKQSLGRFYPAEMVALAVRETRPDLYRRLGTLHCFDCDRCPYAKQCSHPGTEKLYVRLKQRMQGFS